MATVLDDPELLQWKPGRPIGLQLDQMRKHGLSNEEILAYGVEPFAQHSGVVLDKAEPQWWDAIGAPDLQGYRDPVVRQQALRKAGDLSGTRFRVRDAVRQGQDVTRIWEQHLKPYYDRQYGGKYEQPAEVYRRFGVFPKGLTDPVEAAVAKATEGDPRVEPQTFKPPPELETPLVKEWARTNPQTWQAWNDAYAETVQKRKPTHAERFLAERLPRETPPEVRARFQRQAEDAKHEVNKTLAKVYFQSPVFRDQLKHGHIQETMEHGVPYQHDPDSWRGKLERIEYQGEAAAARAVESIFEALTLGYRDSSYLDQYYPSARAGEVWRDLGGSVVGWGAADLLGGRAIKGAGKIGGALGRTKLGQAGLAKLAGTLGELDLARAAPTWLKSAASRAKDAPGPRSPLPSDVAANTLVTKLPAALSSGKLGKAVTPPGPRSSWSPLRRMQNYTTELAAESALFQMVDQGDASLKDTARDILFNAGMIGGGKAFSKAVSSAWPRRRMVKEVADLTASGDITPKEGLAVLDATRRGEFDVRKDASPQQAEKALKRALKDEGQPRFNSEDRYRVSDLFEGYGIDADPDLNPAWNWYGMREPARNIMRGVQGAWDQVTGGMYTQPLVKKNKVVVPRTNPETGKVETRSYDLGPARDIERVSREDRGFAEVMAETNMAEALRSFQGLPPQEFQQAKQVLNGLLYANTIEDNLIRGLPGAKDWSGEFFHGTTGAGRRVTLENIQDFKRAHQELQVRLDAQTEKLSDARLQRIQALEKTPGRQQAVDQIRFGLEQAEVPELDSRIHAEGATQLILSLLGDERIGPDVADQIMRVATADVTMLSKGKSPQGVLDWVLARVLEERAKIIPLPDSVPQSMREDWLAQARALQAQTHQTFPETAYDVESFSRAQDGLGKVWQKSRQAGELPARVAPELRGYLDSLYGAPADMRLSRAYRKIRDHLDEIGREKVRRGLLTEEQYKAQSRYAPTEALRNAYFRDEVLHQAQQQYGGKGKSLQVPDETSRQRRGGAWHSRDMTRVSEEYLADAYTGLMHDDSISSMAMAYDEAPAILPELQRRLQTGVLMHGKEGRWEGSLPLTRDPNTGRMVGRLRDGSTRPLRHGDRIMRVVDVPEHLADGVLESGIDSAWRQRTGMDPEFQVQPTSLKPPPGFVRMRTTTRLPDHDIVGRNLDAEWRKRVGIPANRKLNANQARQLRGYKVQEIRKVLDVSPELVRPKRVQNWEMQVDRANVTDPAQAREWEYRRRREVSPEEAVDGVALDSWMPGYGLYWRRTPEAVLGSEMERFAELLLTNTEIPGNARVDLADVRGWLGGSNRQPIIAPRQVIDVLNDMDGRTMKRVSGPGGAEKVLRQWNSWWKPLSLGAPHRVIPYTTKNVTSDQSVILSSLPRELWPEYTRNLAQAWKDVRLLRNRKPVPDYANQARRYGVLGSTRLEGSEVPGALYDQKLDRLLRKDAPLTLRDLTTDIAKSLPTLGGKQTLKFPEHIDQTTRLAVFKTLLDATERQGKLPTAGRSNVNELQGMDPLGQVAKVSREMAGDYGAISPLGQKLRATAAPWWSFLESNFRSSKNAVRNLTIPERPGLPRTSLGPIAGGAVGVPLLTYMFNRMVVPNLTGEGDLESELSDWIREQDHLIIPTPQEDGTWSARDKYGRIRTVVTPSMISEWMRTIPYFAGVPRVMDRGWNYVNDAMRERAGYPAGSTLHKEQMDWAFNRPSQSLEAMEAAARSEAQWPSKSIEMQKPAARLKYLLNRVALGQLHPLIKGGAEALTGMELSPDVTEPRFTDSRISNAIGAALGGDIERGIKVSKGEPGRAPREFGEADVNKATQIGRMLLDSALPTSNQDPGLTGYYNARNIIDLKMRNLGLSGRSTGETAEQSKALSTFNRQFRARQFDDAMKTYEQEIKGNPTLAARWKERWAQPKVLDRNHPLQRISSKDRQALRENLSEWEEQQLLRGTLFYEQYLSDSAAMKDFERYRSTRTTPRP